MVKVAWICEILEEYSEERRMLDGLGGLREEGLVPPQLKTPCRHEPSAGVAFAFYLRKGE